MRDRLNVSLPVAMISQIGDLAARRKVTRSAVVEAAVASLLSPDSAEKTEAALTRRLDRLTRQMQRQERDLMIALETHALFIRFWLGQMPPPARRGAGRRQCAGTGTLRPVSGHAGATAVSGALLP